MNIRHNVMNIRHEINENYKNLKKVNINPPIYECDNFLTSAECKHLIDTSANNLKESTVVINTGDTNIFVKNPGRDSLSCFLENKNYNSIMRKISKLINKDVRYYEDIQVGKYNKGGFYREHYDSICPSTQDGQTFIKDRGQRIITVLLYLNDVNHGGTTYFRKINKRIYPKKGKVLIFFPSFLNREIDDLTLHAAEDADSTKWISQIWVRDQPQ
jgi:prolyl 4-hydroxylase